MSKIFNMLQVYFFPLSVRVIKMFKLEKYHAKYSYVLYVQHALDLYSYTYLISVTYVRKKQ